jgi:UDP-glucose 4-epimerase
MGVVPKKWLITGGCGFIGTNLIKHLVNEGGHHIRIIDNLSVGTREYLAKICTFKEISPNELSPQSSALSPELVVGDILDEELAKTAAQGIDTIVHLAANTGVAPSVEDPRADCITNVIGTLNYLEAARHNNVKRFIFASSGAPIGECEPPIHENLPAHPVSPYGASKLSGEGYCSAYNRTFGVETIALRFGNVYGPGSGHKNSVVAKFIMQAMKGETLEIYGDGIQTRDFIFIDDLINAIILSSVTIDIGGEVFQIATNSETTIGELTDKLLTVLSRFGHSHIKVLHAKPRLGDVKRNYSDTAKANQILKWRASVNLEEGLTRTVSWFKSSGVNADH